MFLTKSEKFLQNPNLFSDFLNRLTIFTVKVFVSYVLQEAILCEHVSIYEEKRSNLIIFAAQRTLQKSLTLFGETKSKKFYPTESYM
jgi:hypothetical protein